MNSHKIQLYPQESLSGVETCAVSKSTHGSVTSYTVTFLGVDAHLPLRAALPALSPSSATVNVVGGGCARCFGLDQLESGRAYYVSVHANNRVGPSSVAGVPTSVPITARGVPSAPTQVSLVHHSSTSLEVLWHPPASNGGDPIDRYEVSWKRSTDSWANAVSETVMGVAVMGCVPLQI